VPTGFFNQLVSVSAVSSNDVWAVGATGLYIISLHWNGSNWAEVTMAEPANNLIYLTDVEATSANDVWAVGYYESLTVGGDVPLVQHWDGTQWRELTREELGGRPPTYLEAVATLSATDVWIAGYNYTDGVFFGHYSDPCVSTLPAIGK
jgi:hypothetical protein